MATVNEKMTALADEVRELSGTTEAMGIDGMTEQVSAANNEIESQTELLAQAVSALSGKAGGEGNAVLYTEQTLTEEQKAQARANIDALGGKEPERLILEVALTDGVYQQPGGSIGLEAGRTYIVTTDSGSYEAVCKAMSVQGMTAHWLGNMSLMEDSGMEDTGESFYVYEMAGGGQDMAAVMDANGGTSVCITKPAGFLPIDPALLPPGVAPTVVELTTPLALDVALTEEESTALFAAVMTGVPFIIKYSYAAWFTNCVGYANFGSLDGMYFISLPLVPLALNYYLELSSDTGGVWVVKKPTADRA